MNSNPFTLSFGKEPQSLVKREMQSSEIIQNFTAENPGYQACILTGVRGCGKTVSLTTISNTIKENNDWIVVNLNPELDLLEGLASELSNRRDLFDIFREAKINLSFLGFGIEIEGEPPVTDLVSALRKMLNKLTDSGKKVLITIDEAVPSRNFRIFASQFQIFTRENLAVFLLMTGLFENIDLLQNEKTLTFLYRSPKIVLDPLNNSLMAETYRFYFGLSEDEAYKMAAFTKGYSFAFQLLGYLCWTKQTAWQNVIKEFDAYIEEYSYDKIWAECSSVDKHVLFAMAKASSEKVEDIRKYLEMNSSLFSVYRKRLIRKGLISSTSYGYLEYTLPRFGEYIIRNC